MTNKLLHIIVSLFFTVSAVFACTGNCYEPIANAGYDANYYQGSTALLNGSESYDPDDAELELTYTWTAPLGIELIGSDTSTPSFVTPLFNIDEGCSNVDYESEEDCLGNDEFWVTGSVIYIPINLIVNDGEYNSEIDQVLITVVATNTAPILDIPLIYEVTKLSEFTIDASAAMMMLH